MFSDIFVGVDGATYDTNAWIFYQFSNRTGGEPSVLSNALFFPLESDEYSGLIRHLMTNIDALAWRFGYSIRIVQGLHASSWGQFYVDHGGGDGSEHDLEFCPTRTTYDFEQDPPRVSFAVDGTQTAFSFNSNVWYRIVEVFNCDGSFEFWVDGVNIATGGYDHAEFPDELCFFKGCNLAVLVDDVYVDVKSDDSDGDGIADAWEILYFDSLTNATGTSDSDGDGVSDLSESYTGTDPHDPSSVFGFTSASPVPAGLLLKWQAVPGKQYRVEVSSNLLSDFLPAVTNIPSTPPLNTYTIDTFRGECEFHRIGERDDGGQ